MVGSKYSGVCQAPGLKTRTGALLDMVCDIDVPWASLEHSSKDIRKWIKVFHKGLRQLGRGSYGQGIIINWDGLRRLTNSKPEPPHVTNTSCRS